MHVGLYQWDCCCAIETDSQATKHKIQAVNTFVICGYSKAVHRVGRVTFKMYSVTVTNYFIKKVFSNVIQVPQNESNVI